SNARRQNETERSTRAEGHPTVADFFTRLFSGLGWSDANAALAGGIITALIAVNLLVGFVALSAVFYIWVERKGSGRIQDRLGPTRVGGKYGWLQTIADGVKLLVKEDLIPADADHILFRLGPYIAFCGSFAAYVALPFANGWVAQGMTVAVFFMLAVMSTEVFGIILAGYGSGSKWSLFGGMREAAQMVSYEVPMALCVLVPVIVMGSMNLNTISLRQAGPFWNWNVFHDPFTFIAFWTYFTCATASCKRAPFDLAEAESELVAGFHTEYSGLRWSFFFMAEYGSMFAVSGIAIHLFLGGWNLGIFPYELSDWLRGPLGDAGWVLGNVINVAVFIAKGAVLVFVMVWVRWTLPRLRIDQVMMTCLKYLLPIGCVLLLGVSLWQVAMPAFVLSYLKFVLAGVCVALVVWLVVKMFSTQHHLPFSGVPEDWWRATPAGANGARKP
ncbi:MAG TPA: complex I subunit 1 family protein, partial [Gemmataceae bacterium]|nr:complex I subunit 1 family protein [Gemmataceae bacterium]